MWNYCGALCRQSVCGGLGDTNNPASFFFFDLALCILPVADERRTLPHLLTKSGSTTSTSSPSFPFFFFLHANHTQTRFCFLSDYGLSPLHPPSGLSSRQQQRQDERRHRKRNKATSQRWRVLFSLCPRARITLGFSPGVKPSVRREKIKKNCLKCFIMLG